MIPAEWLALGHSLWGFRDLALKMWGLSRSQAVVEGCASALNSKECLSQMCLHSFIRGQDGSGCVPEIQVM